MYDQIKIRIGKFFVDWLERHGITVIAVEELQKLREENRLATLGECTCNCGKQVNNAWRDSDGYHCLTCLAGERDRLREDLDGVYASNPPRMPQDRPAEF